MVVSGGLMIDIRCPVCNRKQFIIKGKPYAPDIEVEVKCTKCSALLLIKPGYIIEVLSEGGKDSSASYKPTDYKSE